MTDTVDLDALTDDETDNPDGDPEFPDIEDYVRTDPYSRVVLTLAVVEDGDGTVNLTVASRDEDGLNIHTMGVELDRDAVVALFGHFRPLLDYRVAAEAAEARRRERHAAERAAEVARLAFTFARFGRTDSSPITIHRSRCSAADEYIPRCGPDEVIAEVKTYLGRAKGYRSVIERFTRYDRTPPTAPKNPLRFCGRCKPLGTNTGSANDSLQGLAAVDNDEHVLTQATAWIWEAHDRHLAAVDGTDAPAPAKPAQVEATPVNLDDE